jgi:hypothetical protein
MGWVVSVTPRPRFTPGERTPGTHWTGGWVGPSAGLDAETRKKSFVSVGDRTPVVQSVVSHYTDWAAWAPEVYSSPDNKIPRLFILEFEGSLPCTQKPTARYDEYSEPVKSSLHLDTLFLKNAC